MKLTKKISNPLVVISLSFVMLLASYSNIINITTPTVDASFLTPIPDEILADFKEGTPIISKLQAVIVARAYLDTTRLKSTTHPKVISVIEEHQNVWKIVFEGDWLVRSPDPDHTATPATPEHVCVFVTIDGIDQVRTEIGTIACSR